MSKATKIFLDANVIIEAGKPPGGPLLMRIKDLVNAKLLKVYTTDLTINEVAKKHTHNDYNVIKEIGRPHFRKLIKEYEGSSLSEISKTELWDKIFANYLKLTKAMMKGLKSETLNVDDVAPSKILDDYTHGQGFFTKESKKDQFPDAFAFETLKALATDESPLYIVSNDKDFVAGTKSDKTIKLVNSIQDLFVQLNLKPKGVDVAPFLAIHHASLIDLAQNALDDWGLYIGDVMDAEIDDQEITDVQFTEIGCYGSVEAGGDILVIAKAKIKANISFTHPNWDEAMYDSEDGRLIPFENVSGKQESMFNVGCSILIAANNKDKPSEILDFSFTDTHIFIDIDHRHDEYF